MQSIYRTAFSQQNKRFENQAFLDNIYFYWKLIFSRFFGQQRQVFYVIGQLFEPILPNLFFTQNA